MISYLHVIRDINWRYTDPLSYDALLDTDISAEKAVSRVCWGTEFSCGASFLVLRDNLAFPLLLLENPGLICRGALLGALLLVRFYPHRASLPEDLSVQIRILRGSNVVAWDSQRGNLYAECLLCHPSLEYPRWIANFPRKVEEMDSFCRQHEEQHVEEAKAFFLHSEIQ